MQGKIYYGTKRIEAWPEEKDGKPGYGVKYADGYISWSPKKTFEESYHPHDRLPFHLACYAEKIGKKIQVTELQRFPLHDAALSCRNALFDGVTWETVEDE